MVDAGKSPDLRKVLHERLTLVSRSCSIACVLAESIL